MSFWQNGIHFFSRHRRFLWTAAFVLSISFFAAKTASLIAGHILFPIQLQKSTRTGIPLPAQWNQRADIPRILSRNIFDSKAQERKPQAGNENFDDSEIRPSTMNAELLGTVVFKNDRYSVALVRDRGSNTMSYYGPGDSLLDSSIVKIERFRIIVRRAGHLESLELQAAKNALSALLPKPSVGGTGKPQFEDLGNDRYLIPQSELDSALSNLGQIMKAARAIPNVVNGQVSGFRMEEVKDNSIFQKLGIRNGDIVKKINEDELNSPEKAMGLFTALRNEKSISIDIERNGSRLNYTYEIR